MGLRPLWIFYSVSVGIDFRRQILTSKVVPHAEKVKLSALLGRRPSNLIWQIRLVQIWESFIHSALAVFLPLKPSKWNDWMIQCWCNAGPSSTTLAQHYTNIGVGVGIPPSNSNREFSDKWFLGLLWNQDCVILLAQFSLYVHEGGLKTRLISFHLKT